MSSEDLDGEAEGERANAALRREMADAKARIGADALKMLGPREHRSFEPRRRREQSED